eukprot:NODE_166_length_16344_cov_0.418775.p5 type:complete len:291 gc:universal NODE_166_length_16344_cov_0.418775:4990-4118(-)
MLILFILAVYCQTAATTATNSILDFDPHKALTGQPQSAPDPNNEAPPPPSSSSSNNLPTVSGSTSSENGGTASATISEAPSSDGSGGFSYTWIITGTGCGAAVAGLAGIYVMRNKKRKRKQDEESLFSFSSKSTSSASRSVKSPMSEFNVPFDNEATNSPPVTNSDVNDLNNIRTANPPFQIKNVESYELSPSPKTPLEIQPNTMHSVTPFQQTKTPNISAIDLIRKESCNSINSINSIASSAMSDIETTKPVEDDNELTKLTAISTKNLNSVCSSRKAFSTTPVSPYLI